MSSGRCGRAADAFRISCRRAHPRERMRSCGRVAMAPIAVAATAPFGADVLERLAGRHDVSALLTRPDAPQGRGRRVTAAARQARRGAAWHPRASAGAAEPGLDLGAPTAIVCAYGLLIPEALLDERAGSTSIPRSSRAGAERRRSSGRSSQATRRPASRSTRPWRARRRPDRGAGGVPARAGGRRRRRLRAGGGGSRHAPSRRRPRRSQPGVRAAAVGRGHLRGQDRLCRPHARSRPAGERAGRCGRSRRTSAPARCSTAVL